MPVNNRQPSMARPNTVNRQPQGQAAAPQGRPLPPNMRGPQAPGAQQPEKSKQAALPRAAEASKRPSSKLILVIISLVLSVVGAVLVAVGVFVLKDPKPKHTAWPSGGSYQDSTVVAPPVPTVSPAVIDEPTTQEQPETAPGEDASAQTESAQTEDGTGEGTDPAGTDMPEQPVDEGASGEQPENDADDAGDGAPADDSNMTAAARMPSGESLFMPLVSMTTPGGSENTAEPPETGAEEPVAPTETPAENNAAPEGDGTVPEPSEEGVDGTAPDTSETQPTEGDAAAGTDDAQTTEPAVATPAPTQPPTTESTPEPGPVFTPLQEEEESSFGAKQIVTLIGAILVGAGCVLALVAGFLQHAAITGLGRELASLQEEVQRYAHEHRDPTFADKLKYAFEQIPTLTLEEAKARTEPRRAPAPEQPYPAPAPAPQPPVSLAEQGDAEYNKLLAQGGQAAAQAMISGSAFSGAGIDVNGCLYAYQSGQSMPYRVVGANKSWSVQYFMFGAGSTAPTLYPNPYALEQNGLANAQNLQYILNAFNIIVNGAALTPQNIGSASGRLRIRRVAGARMDAQNTVIQKGQIEMG